MYKDTYSERDCIAKCAKCGKFMPWERSRVIETSDCKEEPSPIYVECGLCVKCEARDLIK
jgi:hypothetical protein